MRLLLLITLSLLAVWGDSHLDFCQESCQLPLTATTLNTYLVEEAPLRKERALALAEYFEAENETDFLCLQEIWNPILRLAVLSGLPERLGYNYSALNNATCTQGCATSDITPIRECVNTSNCASDNFTCIFDACWDQMSTLEESCQVCLGSNSNVSFEERLSICEGKENATNSTSQCTLSPVGNLIISAYPLSETSFLDFNDTEGRGVLYAQAQLDQGGQVGLFCAHLSPALSDETIQIQMSEINSMLTFVEENAQPGNLIFIMGDFNTGPQVNNETVGIATESYALLNDSLTGYTNIYLEFSEDTNCTACLDNPLSSVENSSLIDYIFVRDEQIRCLIEVSRVFVDPIVTTPEGNVPISDHYGISVTLCSTIIESTSATSSATGATSGGTAPTGNTQQPTSYTQQPTVDGQPTPDSSSMSIKLSILLIVASLVFYFF